MFSKQNEKKNGRNFIRKSISDSTKLELGDETTERDWN